MSLSDSQAIQQCQGSVRFPRNSRFFGPDKRFQHWKINFLIGNFVGICKRKSTNKVVASTNAVVEIATDVCAFAVYRETEPHEQEITLFLYII
jgi:hypothetical protein